MLTFKAILTASVKYKTLEGASKSLPAGTIIGVSRIDSALHSTDLTGKTGTEPVNSYYGILADDTFDLKSSEFRLTA